jgi:hypothetical protein
MIIKFGSLILNQNYRPNKKVKKIGLFQAYPSPQQIGANIRRSYSSSIRYKQRPLFL